MTTSPKVRACLGGVSQAAFMALAVFVLALGIALTVPAPAQAATTTHEVTFMTYDPDISGTQYHMFPDGSNEKTIQVEDGSAISVSYFRDYVNFPIDKGEQFPFLYWMKYDLISKKGSVWYPDEPVTEDMVLFAFFGNNRSELLVTFMYPYEKNADTVISADYVDARGGTVAHPADPQRNGYDFKGWYKDRECTQEFDFSTVIRDDTKIYAKLVAKQYTVTFNANGGSGDTTQQVDYRKTATSPEGVARTGYTLAGWYTDAACSDGNEYNLDKPITGDLTLYAKWTVNAYTVAFDTKGGTPATIESQTVQFGGKVSKPEDPTKEGDGFYAWYTEDGKKWDFDNDTVQGDMTLHAEWVEGGNDGMNGDKSAKKDDPKNSDSKKSGSKQTIPQTGDNALIAICIAGAAGIAAVIAGIVVRHRKN